MRLLPRFPIVLSALAVLTVGLVGATGSAAFRQTPTTGQVAVLGSTMLGANEVPGPGDPNASGSTVVTLNPLTGLVCYVIKVSGLSSPITKGHIHRGAATVAGPVVIPFPLTGGPNTYAGCTHADRGLIQDIIASPSDYYTNVHNAPFPGGAMRGQLSSLVPGTVDLAAA
jgi:hypothetical protein